MDKPEYIQTIVQVALMYYKDNLTQQEIANRLGTTRQNVSKMINEAREKGIVEIKILNPLDNIRSLSEDMEKTFNIKKAVTVACDFKNEQLIREVIAQRAVEHVRDCILMGCRKIGLSWGRTIYGFIDKFDAFAANNELKIFPLVGASDKAAPYFMINEMVRRFAEKVGGEPIFINIPVNPGSDKEYKIFTNTDIYKNIYALWNSVDIAIVGIGTTKPKDRLIRQEYPGERTLESDEHEDAIVGDICTNYFDINGSMIKTAEQQNLICISVNQLRKIKKVIAIAGSPEKTEAIIGALRTGIIDEIIIDDVTARNVLEKAKNNNN